MRIESKNAENQIIRRAVSQLQLKAPQICDVVHNQF